MSDNLVCYLTQDGSAGVCCLDSTAIVRRMEQLHHTSATASAALGRTLTAASLMGCSLKDEGNSLTLSIRGNGPIGGITAVSDWRGNVRGYCDVPLADLPENAKGKLDVGGIVGKQGYLYVVKDIGLDVPYVGQTALVSGEIAEDITAYFAASEQVSSVCALGVLVDTDLTVLHAGGFLLQLLPGAREELIGALEATIATLPSVTAMLSAGRTPDDIAKSVLAGLGPRKLESRTVSYRCTCGRARMEQVLISLGDAELRRLAGEQESTEIVCHFCNTKYSFSAAELLKLANDSSTFAVDKGRDI